MSDRDFASFRGKYTGEPQHPFSDVGEVRVVLDETLTYDTGGLLNAQQMFDRLCDVGKFYRVVLFVTAIEETDA